MTQSIHQLLAQALQLSEQERGLLAAKLIESLGFAGDDDAESAWSEEIRQRLAELDAGTVQAIPWSEARRLIMEDTDDPAEC